MQGGRGTFSPVLLIALATLMAGCARQQEAVPATSSEPAGSPGAAWNPATAHRSEAPTGVQQASSPRGMVVAGHVEAAEIGRDILARGGGAMDAAVAVSLALAVAEPYGSGLGGKLLLLYYDRAKAQTTAIDGMDAAPETLDVEAFLAQPRDRRIEGWGAVAVPGLVAGLAEAHRRWGQLPWAQAVQPAADLARRGSRMLPRGRLFFTRRLARLQVSPEAERLFLRDGQPPEVGQRLANPDLSRTLETVAEQGAPGFYEGWVAEAIVNASRDGGGWLTLADLAGYRVRVSEPLQADIHGYTVLSSPPPTSGGATLLVALKLLSGASWVGQSPLEAENLHQIGQVLQQIYPEIQRKIADVPEARTAFEELLSPGRIAAADQTQASSGSGGLSPGGPLVTEELASTTHFVVIDFAGNVASVTQSLSHHFGAGVVAKGTGVLFNNSLKNFATANHDSVNFVAPGKRPRSTIAPTLVLHEGKVALTLGLPGGQRIPTATLQVLLDHLIFETSLAEAIRRPRAHLRRPLDAQEAKNLFELETPNPALAKGLQELGWSVTVNEDSETFGGFCAIEIRPEGLLIGLADQRRTNTARGL